MKNSAAVKVRSGRSLKRRLADNWQLYLLLLMPVIITIIYKYGPMYGIQIAFRDFKPSRGITGSRWVGIESMMALMKTSVTYITLAASSGMDVKTLQSIAGHSDIKMTLDRYAHERENNIISAGSLIGNIFRSM